MPESRLSPAAAADASQGLRLNVGAGTSVAEGYVNVDSSPTLLACKLLPGPLLGALAGILPRGRGSVLREYRAVASRMVYADARRRLPFAEGAAQVVYSSHFLEHIRRAEALQFLKECHRVLRPRGVLRLAVPDLHALALAYVESRLDADAFVEASMLSASQRPSLPRRLLNAALDRHEHLWMYDASSLAALCRQVGFAEPRRRRYLESEIAEVNRLDLPHRAAESAYVEAVR